MMTFAVKDMFTQKTSIACRVNKCMFLNSHGKVRQRNDAHNLQGETSYSIGQFRFLLSLLSISSSNGRIFFRMRPTYVIVNI